MNEMKIEETLGLLIAQTRILKEQISALHEIFFAYLSVEHNEETPNFSQNVKAEMLDILGEKMTESAQQLHHDDRIAQIARERIDIQIQVLKNDLDALLDSMDE